MVHTYTPAPERSTGFCFNSSFCPWPQQCLAESRTRRYCADGPLDAVHGRSLFDLSDERAPGLFSCERCDSPLVNIDFGSPIDAGANRCTTECRLPVGSANATHVGESFLTSNCLTTCDFVPLELYADAVIGSSPYHEGYEPSDELWVARAAAVDAKDAAAAAAVEAAAKAEVSVAVSAVSAGEAAVIAALRAEVVKRDAVIERREAAVVRARAALEIAIAREQRAAEDALALAIEDVAAAKEVRAEAAANVTAELAMRESFVPVLESTAPHDEALLAREIAERLQAEAERVAAAIELVGLKLMPLPERIARAWRHDVWGRAIDARAAGGLLKLTDALPHKTGWAVLRPKTPLASWTVELDLWVGGGTGGEGFSISYAPLTDAALLHADGGQEGVGVTVGRVGVAPAPAARGLGASADYGPLAQAYRGRGLSLALRTRPDHAAQVWLDGELVVEAAYTGCPHPVGAFGGQCAPCAECPNCPACALCVPTHACPLRTPRDFVRVVLQLTAATADAPPALRAVHNGLSLFGDEPVPLPGFVCDAACALVLGARSGSGTAGATDHHWVDNLRMSGPPGQPAPPVLVNATATSLLLAWFPPHHGGEEVLLYRLRMWRGTRWLNLYVGARANHTVHYLEQGTAHLFRLQAYNTNGWGASSPSASFATVTWPLASHAAPPRVPRVNAGSCVCGGKLYVAGGQSVGSGGGAGGPVLGALEEYDLASRTWVRRAEMTTPRSHLALACVLNTTLVAVGGYGTAGTAPYIYPRFLSAVEEYHPARDAWVTRPDSRSARYYLSAVGTAQGDVYAVGGYGVAATGAAATFNESVLATVEKLDPATGVWTRKTDLPQAAYGIGLGVFGCTSKEGGAFGEQRCRLLAVGGYAAGGFTDAAFVYDTKMDEWTYAAALPAPRFVPSVLAFATADAAYMSGGYELSLPSASARALHRQASLASVFEYSLHADSWVEVPTKYSWRPVQAFDWRPSEESGHLGAIAQATFDEDMATKLPLERVGQAWWLSRENKPMESRTIYVPSAELTLPEPQRCRHGRGPLGCLHGYGIQRDGLGRSLPHTALEGDCTAEGTSIRTAEGEDACYYERTELTPAVYPPVWFPPLDFHSGIIKVGDDGVYEDEDEDEAARKAFLLRAYRHLMGNSETDADKPEDGKI